MRRIFSAGIALAVAAPFAALAQSSPPSQPEIQSLRQEIEAMRATYESRLQALEQRLLLAQTSAAPVPMAPHDAIVEPIASATAPTSEGATGGANAFNPAMSLILSGGFNRTSRDPANYHISGFALPVGADVGPGSRGFSLAESELGFAASIDPWLRGAANISLHPNNTVSVEEVFVQTTALTDGLSFKAGRFFSGVGYLNSQHSHTWDFVDNPLAYQALLGTQYGDDGVQLHWLAPAEQFIELGAEIGRGRSFPGSDSGRNGAGMGALTAHIGGDVGDSNNWRAGVSVLSARATALGLTATNASGNSISSQFSGTSRVWVLDGVWKWAPDGNATRINF